MKKYLPVLLFFAGLVIVGGILFLTSRSKKQPVVQEEQPEVAREIPQGEKPLTSLTPSSDGHWLKLKVDDIKVQGTESLDYEILYKVKDGRTQGVPGTIQLKSQNSLERDILLGSESSGKFKFDEGVNQGTLTLRFRNSDGKLVGKLSTDFHLQSNTKELTSVDGKFKYLLDKIPKGTFFVTMETFSKGYAVFSSSSTPIIGTIE
ncbi:hypothetical protein A2627_02965 [Candidatus Woesebacteria bacterium RIFCSPHIGHO2_01_FULL_39_28]|uniref:Uncharacterized protein n=1 Tax=Candidatus Woesebacteria bacterium RIFCSPHIGHO2_01_FULL_39_28 TaxID=1802496 RepID=A0A1F7YC33_9BACT|nr:MAG: hypothetical protein A2627_02965 [Candidatus Woesebacteria bacterium RIFCSPHIGHO2_01_FULL_39_28]OGM58008.1 MAG: hypothetical protein A3A50_01975 [Candidatus Woesebacteria bacterium RIFCSPLOWO2_01_FULL_38_20]